MGAAIAELEAKLPGMAAHLEPDHPGMHTTQTVDIGLVLTGEIDLELDDGATQHLVAGDFVIQNGTRHAWRNRSGAPTTMAFVLVEPTWRSRSRLGVAGAGATQRRPALIGHTTRSAPTTSATCSFVGNEAPQRCEWLSGFLARWPAQDASRNPGVVMVA